MATQITNYQCPACTGPLQFSADSGKLECEYCGSSFEVSQVEQLYTQKEAAAEKAWDTSQVSADWGEEAAGMRAYNCPSCGAELICEETTAATTCPYCGNPSVVPGQFAGALRPEYVIPFGVDKARALELLKAHYKKKLLLPSAFTAQQQLEKVQGIYVPFWLFDATVAGSCTYNATRVRVHHSPNKRTTVTKHYRVHRGGSVAFEKIPVDAARKMPDGHMDALEPFDYSALKPFSTAYLPGFLADKYDAAAQDCAQRADIRCENTFEAAMRASVDAYDTCILHHKQVHIHRGKVHYALLPVWLMQVNWHGKNFLFAVNGQTGKLVGDLPVDWAKAAGLFAAIAVPLSVIAHLLVRLFVG